MISLRLKISYTFKSFIFLLTKGLYTMKKYTIFILLLFTFLYDSNAQSSKIATQIMIVESAKGSEKINAQIRLSELYMAEDFYKKAIKPAKEAKKAALETNRKELAAIALNREGKATYSSKILRGRKKGEKLLKESLSVLPNGRNISLKIENLELLEKYSRLRGNAMDSYNYKKQLAVIKGLPMPKPPEKVGGRFNKKRKMIEEISEEKELLSEQKEELSDELKSATAETKQLKTQRSKMDRALTIQRERISNLSKSQMEQEMELMEKARLLDSLEFVRVLDSFKLKQQMVVLKEQNMELRQQSMKLDLQKSQRNFWGALAAIGLLVGLGLWSRYRGIKKHSEELEEKNELIAKEQERSDELLLNILPKTVAEELKEKGVAKARKYDLVTVLFTDFVGFSKSASEMAPEVLVYELDFYFKKFDEIISKYGLEKIKTIGDSYMCAGGLPERSANHPFKVIKAAIEIQAFVNQWMDHKKAKGEVYFEARLGIHSGPIVAGVVGKKKYAYDIWGNTVNIASRLESACEPGQINISKATYDLIKNGFEAESRGKISAKNIGEIEMYYVKV